MRRFRSLGLFLALILLCSGCIRSKPAQRQVFAMDTIMSFTAYGKQAEEALTQAEAYLHELETALSVTREESEISQVNRAAGEWVSVPIAFDILSAAERLCGLTGGALDITAYPAVKAWGFTTGEHRVPDQTELTGLIGRIDYTALELDAGSQSARLPDGMELDLGAVAKGWAGEELAKLLKGSGVTSATLSLGGNVQTIGSKPDGSPWRVGIQDPLSAQGTSCAIVEVADQAVVTSGGYERYFEENGVHYCHIIDPDTAAPAQAGLTSVTIVGDSGTVCDGLSTALFVMGAEQAAQFWRTHPELNFDYILMLEDGSIHITQGLEPSFSLTDGYTDRKVTVIAP